MSVLSAVIRIFNTVSALIMLNRIYLWVFLYNFRLFSLYFYNVRKIQMNRKSWCVKCGEITDKTVILNRYFSNIN